MKYCSGYYLTAEGVRQPVQSQILTDSRCQRLMKKLRKEREERREAGDSGHQGERGQGRECGRGRLKRTRLSSCRVNK